MRRPAQLLGLLLSLAACEPGPVVDHEPAAASVQLRVELDERSVLVGEVVERLDAGSYVYLRLSIVSDSATPRLAPHTQLRWVAVDGRAPGLGDRVRARSLARRTRVWAPELNRDFEVLEYVALLPDR